MISVLYVDDDSSLLEIGKIFLEKMGNFTVEPCTSAPEALQRLEQTAYSAVLSDYDMPVMNGIRFLKEVRAKYPTLPFVIFTGRGREDVVVEAINNGVDFYLQKGGELKSQFAELAHKLRIAVERHQSEEQIRHLARLYAVLSRTNEAAVNIRNLNGLLTEACRIAVTEGGFLMAWCGMIRRNRTRFEAVAHCSCADTASGTAAEPGTDLPLDMAPTSLALRENRYYICADNRTDPSVGPWRDKLLSCGYRSSAAFPIWIGGHVSGVMTFHAAEANFFSEEEVQLLVELTDNLSFALEMMEQEKKREEVEELLGITRFAIDRAVDGAYLVSRDGKFVYVNTKITRILGYSHEEMLSMKITDIDRRFQPPESGSWKDHVSDIRKKGAMIFETGQKRKDGMVVQVQITAHHLTYAGKEYIWAFLRETARTDTY
ncbi:MAG: response regulator [Methanoregula sp.]|jgi:PAS domain S-box-containing protein